MKDRYDAADMFAGVAELVGALVGELRADSPDYGRAADLVRTVKVTLEEAAVELAVWAASVAELRASSGRN